MAAAEAIENHEDETWADTYYEGYIHQLQPETTHKFH